MPKEELREILSVSSKTINRYLKDIDDRIKEERKELIFDAWLRCDTQEEIAASVGISKAEVSREIEVCFNLDRCPKSNKLHALFQDEKFQPPIYNIWSFKALTNGVQHFGNSEQSILDNLIYAYTDPFDIVVGTRVYTYS